MGEWICGHDDQPTGSFPVMSNTRPREGAFPVKSKKVVWLDL